MAQANPNAAVRAANGFVGTTHIMAVTDVSVKSVADVTAEAQAEGFIVVAIENDVASDGCHIALQGAGATPSLTGATLVVTFS
jgi:hypothetical protein|tara:strand:- start:1253 stop:1501 length:249 start_codon:yes stop_codon:yes gene_type:complete